MRIKIGNALRPRNLMSLLLKAPEQLIDSHTKDDVLKNVSLHQDKCAYHADQSTETAIHQQMYELMYVLGNKEIV